MRGPDAAQRGRTSSGRAFWTIQSTMVFQSTASGMRYQISRLSPGVQQATTGSPGLSTRIGTSSPFRRVDHSLLRALGAGQAGGAASGNPATRRTAVPYERLTRQRMDRRVPAVEK